VGVLKSHYHLLVSLILSVSSTPRKAKAASARRGGRDPRNSPLQINSGEGRCDRQEQGKGWRPSNIKSPRPTSVARFLTFLPSFPGLRERLRRCKATNSQPQAKVPDGTTSDYALLICRSVSSIKSHSSPSFPKSASSPKSILPSPSSPPHL